MRVDQSNRRSCVGVYTVISCLRNIGMNWLYLSRKRFPTNKTVITNASCNKTFNLPIVLIIYLCTYLRSVFYTFCYCNFVRFYYRTTCWFVYQTSIKTNKPLFAAFCFKITLLVSSLILLNDYQNLLFWINLKCVPTYEFYSYSFRGDKCICSDYLKYNIFWPLIKPCSRVKTV